MFSHILRTEAKKYLQQLFKLTRIYQRTSEDEKEYKLEPG